LRTCTLAHSPIIIPSHSVSHTLHGSKSHRRLPWLPGCHILCEVLAESEEAVEHQTYSAKGHTEMAEILQMALGFIFPNNKYNTDERDRVAVRGHCGSLSYDGHVTNVRIS
jgi:hypothetical protein